MLSSVVGVCVSSFNLYPLVYNNRSLLYRTLRCHGIRKSSLPQTREVETDIAGEKQVAVMHNQDSQDFFSEGTYNNHSPLQHNCGSCNTTMLMMSRRRREVHLVAIGVLMLASYDISGLGRLGRLNPRALFSFLSSCPSRISIWIYARCRLEAPFHNTLARRNVQAVPQAVGGQRLATFGICCWLTQRRITHDLKHPHCPSKLFSLARGARLPNGPVWPSLAAMICLKDTPTSEDERGIESSVWLVCIGICH